MHTTGKAGHLIYGPYERFEAGRYRITLQGEVDQWTQSENLKIVCDSGRSQLYSVVLSDEPVGVWRLEIEFFVGSTCHDLEIQFLVHEDAIVSIENISIKKIKES